MTSHLEALADLAEAPDGTAPGEGCSPDSSRTYRFQVGYADGRVAQVVGASDPACLGTLSGSGTSVRGPAALGVYGTVMAAFGRQHADGHDPAASTTALTCPEDPRRPDSVDVDGSSTGPDTGWHLGRRAPMVMPLSAVRGLLCTYPHGGGEPTTRDLTPEEAERVRIGLHAVFNAMVDCAGSPDPTYTAVVEDKTGTRRAVTVIGSECDTVVRSDDGYGLGFAWLER